jgi:hypothetical protein
MRYTIYQTTNKNNGKIYIGKHQTENPNDSYLGSGISLRNAIKKYGIENFEKIILFDFDTEQEMNNKEREIITEEFVKRKDTYNKGVGGEGGPHFRGKKHSLESRQKMGIPGRKFSQEVRQKISEANKKRNVSEETRKKLSISRYLLNGKTLEEAIYLTENKKPKEKVKKSKSEILLEYYKDPANRLKKADQVRKLHKEHNLEEIKKDYDLGLKPKDIMKKYNMTKNRYDHIRSYYLKS